MPSSQRVEFLTANYATFEVQIANIEFLVTETTGIGCVDHQVATDWVSDSIERHISVHTRAYLPQTRRAPRQSVL